VKINIEVCLDKEMEVLIKGNPSSSEVTTFINYVNEFGLETGPNKIILRSGEKDFIKNIEDIWYFEGQGNKVRAIIDEAHYTCKYKLYELESFDDKGYVRVSKGLIVNVNKIDFIEIEFSGNYVITLKNGHRLTLSRKYVKAFKQYVEEVL